MRVRRRCAHDRDRVPHTAPADLVVFRQGASAADSETAAEARYRRGGSSCQILVLARSQPRPPFSSVAVRCDRLRAQTPEEFYKGRQLTMIVYSPAGSAYDIYARVLIRHMGKHIPGNPTFIVQYVVGAGGLKAIETLYRIAPKDGSVMGTVGRGLPFEPFLGRNELKYDPLRLTWIGSMNREATLAMSWHTSKVKTYEDSEADRIAGARAPARAPIPRSFRSPSTASPAPSSRSSPAIATPRKRRSPWSVASSKGSPTGRGARSSPSIPTGCRRRRSTSCSIPAPTWWRTFPTCG